MERTKLHLLFLFLFLLSTSLIPSSSSTTSTSKGRWKLLARNLGISAMHMQLLPNDRLLAFDRTDAGPSNISLPSISSTSTITLCLNLTTHTDCTSHSIEFNPSTRTIRPLILTSETWCSSGSLSSNGTLIQTGGFASGDHAVRSFSPSGNSDWVENLQGLDARRWYSTDHILPDGRVIVVGGRAQFNYEFVPKNTDSDRAVFPLPFLEETKDGNSENNLYPFVHLSTDGNLFIFANTKAILLDYKTNKVVKRYQEMPGGISRNYPSSGSSVLLPLQLGSSTEIKAEVMVCGGATRGAFPAVQNGTFLEASRTCGRLIITEESPVWGMEEMPVGRVMGDMVLLPTGDVLIINGAEKGTAGWGNARDPVLIPVLYRTGVLEGLTMKVGFEVMTSTTIPRLYHSTAHLISDGRVVVGGSNPNIKYEFDGVLFPTELSLEAFSPPYFMNSKIGINRPRIISIEANGGEVVYGDKLRMRFVMKGSTNATLIERLHVTMVAPSFTTHSFSMNQRLLVLERKVVRRVREEMYVVEVVGPRSEVLAPPGYYMVFVVCGGVPSRGRWVHVRSE